MSEVVHMNEDDTPELKIAYDCSEYARILERLLKINTGTYLIGCDLAETLPDPTFTEEPQNYVEPILPTIGDGNG